MPRLRRLATALLAASTVAIGGLAIPGTAAAMPMTCEVKLAIASTYIATANIFLGVGNAVAASYWAGRAQGIMDGC